MGIEVVGVMVDEMVADVVVADVVVVVVIEVVALVVEKMDLCNKLLCVLFLSLQMPVAFLVLSYTLFEVVVVGLHAPSAAVIPFLFAFEPACLVPVASLPQFLSDVVLLVHAEFAIPFLFVIVPHVLVEFGSHVLAEFGSPFLAVIVLLGLVPFVLVVLVAAVLVFPVVIVLLFFAFLLANDALYTSFGLARFFVTASPSGEEV